MAEYVTSNTRASWSDETIAFDHRRLSAAAVGGQRTAGILGPTLAVQTSIPWARVTGVRTDGRWVRLEVQGPRRIGEDPYGLEADTADDAERLAAEWRQYVM